MKKILFSALMMMGLVSLSSCVKDAIEAPWTAAPAGNFEIVADLGTKTVNNGSKTEWAEGDALTLLSFTTGEELDWGQRENDTKWTCHGKFDLTDKSQGVFSGTLAEELVEANKYAWVAVYPYDAAYKDAVGFPNAEATDATDDDQILTIGHPVDGYATQVGNSSKAHLAGKYFPLYGRADDTQGTAVPSFQMHQLAAVLAVNVTNASDAPLTVSKVFVTHSAENLIGSFAFELGWVLGGHPGKYAFARSKNASKTSVLRVENAEAIPVGESAVFYLPIRPCEFAANSTLSIQVNDVYTDVTIAEDVEIFGGKMKTVNVDYAGVVDNGSTFEEGTKAFLEHIIATEGYGLSTPTTLKNFAPAQYPGINFAQDGSGAYYIREIYYFGTGTGIFSSFPSTINLPNCEQIYINCTDDGTDAATMADWMKCSLKGSELPTTWNCPKMWRVHLECTGMTGVISDSFAALPNLAVIFFRCNDFYGALPHNWASTKFERIGFTYNGASADSPNLGYVLPASLDVILNSEKPNPPREGDLNMIQICGSLNAANWVGFEKGWGQKRYVKFGGGTQDDLDTWSDYRMLTEGSADEIAPGGLRNPNNATDPKFIDSWGAGAWWLNRYEAIPKVMVEWNQADADAYTAAAKAKARIFTR